jgi:hypothetical protein
MNARWKVTKGPYFWNSDNTICGKDTNVPNHSLCLHPPPLYTLWLELPGTAKACLNIGYKSGLVLWSVGRNVWRKKNVLHITDESFKCAYTKAAILVVILATVFAVYKPYCTFANGEFPGGGGKQSCKTAVLITHLQSGLEVDTVCWSSLLSETEFTNKKWTYFPGHFPWLLFWSATPS